MEKGGICLDGRKKKKRGADGFLIFLVLLLVVCGLIFLYSTSAYNGRVKFHDSAYYFKKQLFATSLGLMGMYLVSFMDYHLLVKMAPFFYGVSLVLSLAVLLSERNITALRDGFLWGRYLFSLRSFLKWQ